MTSAIVIDASGRQAERYLQSRLSNDVRACSHDRAVLAAALTAQGRVQALFTLFQPSSGSFRLLADGGTAETVLTSLRQFIVSERVDTVVRTPDYTLLHIFSDETATAPAIFLPTSRELSISSDSTGVISITRQRGEWRGVDLLVPNAEVTRVMAELKKAGAQALSSPEFYLYRVKSGRPAFPEEINEQHNLLEAGQASLVSFTKGCYVGQEVIARIDSLGKPPTLLWRLSAASSAAIAVGSSVSFERDGESKNIGTVVTTAVDSASATCYCFAYLRNIENLDHHELHIAGAAINAAAPATALA